MDKYDSKPLQKKRGHEHPCFEDNYESFEQVVPCLYKTGKDDECLHLSSHPGNTWWNCTGGRRNDYWQYYEDWRNDNEPATGREKRLEEVLRNLVDVAELLIRNGDVRGPMSLQGWCIKAREALKKAGGV